LVQQISGVDFNTYCKQNIFTPLGVVKVDFFFAATAGSRRDFYGAEKALSIAVFPMP
jgi:CubicO group peptidase (beta-lactamase class C family)